MELWSLGGSGEARLLLNGILPDKKILKIRFGNSHQQGVLGKSAVEESGLFTALSLATL